MRQPRLDLALVLLLVLTSFYTVREAAALTLADLIDTGASLTVGDKVFSDFTADFGFLPGTSGMDASDVTIMGISQNGQHGLSLTANFLADSSNPFLRGNIGYTVTSPHFITSITLTADPQVRNVQIPTQLDFFAGVTVDVDSIPTVMKSTMADFGTAPLSGQQQYNIDTFILLDVVSEPGAIASLSFVDVTFAQTPIPEPSAGLLVASGLAGLGLWRSGIRGTTV